MVEVKSSRSRFLGETGVFATYFLYLQVLQLVEAAPVRTPAFSTCQVSRYTKPELRKIDCCPPAFHGTVKNFTFPVASAQPLRVRPAIQCADEAYLHKLEKAYSLMRALPRDDPRSFYQQSIVHCAYCGGAFFQEGTNNSIDIHFCWLFFPWHRAFLYFHERILQSLLNDTTFSLPFWNYDNQLSAFEGSDVELPASDPAYCFKAGNKFPSPYLKNGSSLSARRRFFYGNVTDSSDLVVDLAIPYPYRKDPRDFRLRSRSYAVASNLKVVHQSMVQAATKPEIFFGAPIRRSDPQSFPILDTFAAIYGGSVEMGLHASAHLWVGAAEEPLASVPGLWNAASDPVFYANHANIDRLWNVWKSLRGGRKDLDDPDFLNAEFMFYDENLQVVRIKIADLLSTEKLGYTYQTVPNPWISYDNSPICSQTPLSSLLSIMERTTRAKELPSGPKRLPVSDGEKLHVVVERPAEAVGSEKSDEVLVISGIKIRKNLETQFVMFLNYPNATSITPWLCAEFVGRFIFRPLVGGPDRDLSSKRFGFKAGIGDNLQQLNVERLPSVMVSIVGLINSTDGQEHAIMQTLSFEEIKIEI